MTGGSFSVLPHIGNDHYPILWHPTFKIPSQHRNQPIKRTYWKLFQCFLTFTGSFWQSLATNMNHTAAFFTLYERFLTLSLSRLTTISLRATMKPSVPQTVVDLIKEKRRVLKLFRQTRHPFFAVALRDMSKLVQKQLFHYKREAWMKYCKSFNECDTKSFWTKAKRHFGRKNTPIEGFLNNGVTVTNPEAMCMVAKEYYEEQFADHLLTQSEIEIKAAETDAKMERNLKDHLPTPLTFTYAQLRSTIGSLKNKNSSGLDGISNKIIKLLPQNHLSMILSCMNHFTATQCTPPHWLIARIILLPKAKTKIVSIADTRPISLLPCFSKVFEKCFMIHFRQWINEQGVLPSEQTGFRPGHNMAVRLVSIVDQIGQSLSKNTAAAALFVDFRSAFNQLWFNGLWRKLAHLQCPSHMLVWLRHYLRKRKSYIEIKNSTSTTFDLCKGVPQGSCIGPLLFIMYDHDILESLSTIHWKHLFADDLAILFAPSPFMHSANSILSLTNQIENVLAKLIKYSDKWKQPINFSKTCWILFHRQVAPQIKAIVCGGHTIEHVSKFKYLGTLLDAKLSFAAHIDYTRSKIRSNLSIFKRMVSNRMMSEEVRYRLFNAFIRPYLQSILNIYPVLATTKQRQIEGFNRNIYRTVSLWHDARNIEIQNLPKYQSLAALTSSHWSKLTKTILITNPEVIEDFLQHKLALVYLHEYLHNPKLAKERKKIFSRGRVHRNIRKLLDEKRLSLFDHTLCYQ